MRERKSFAAAISCIDGRAHEPLIYYLKESYGVDFVDLITEAGAVRFVSENDTSERDELLRKIRISLDAHQPEIIVVAAHHDCAGNPVNDDVQKQQLSRAKRYLRSLFPDIKVIAVWLDADFNPEEI